MKEKNEKTEQIKYMETCVYTFHSNAETIYKSLIADKDDSIDFEYDAHTKILTIRITTEDAMSLIKTIKHFNEKLSLCYKTIEFVKSNS